MITYTIPPCEGKRYAISDIHGCTQTFRALVQKINLQPEDHLFLLGDYINKGPDSKGVLDFILELQEKHQVFCLRGNHEEMLLKAHYKAKEYQKNSDSHTQANEKRTVTPFRGRGVVDEKRQILPKYLSLLENMVYYFELPDFFLVHAGFDFDSPSPFTDTEKMIWLRYFEVDTKFVGEKRVIHGHVPEYIQFIQEEIDYGCPSICIDNGCVFVNRKDAGMGNLLALDLDTLEITTQENIETARSSTRSRFFTH